jgi:hypothetical protein
MSVNDITERLGSFCGGRDTKIPIDFTSGQIKYDVMLLDNNNSNVYNFANPTWSSNTLGATNEGELYLPEQAVVEIPIEYSIAMVSGGTFQDTAGNLVPSNVCGLAKKSNLAFFDRSTQSLGGVQLSLQQNSQPYYAMVRSHSVNDEQRKFLYEEMLDHYYPNPLVSQYYSSTGQNDNKSTWDDENKNTVYNLAEVRNDIFQKQGAKFFNVENTVSGNVLASIGSGEQNYALQYQKHFVDASLNLVWRDVVRVPLSEVSVIGKLPPCANLNSMSLKLEMPSLANGVYMDVSFNALADVTTADQSLIPAGFNYSAGSSQLFPFILGSAGHSAAGNKKGYALCIKQSANNASVKIRISGKVGWSSISGGGQCRILLPTVYAPKLLEEIASKPSSSIDVLDALIDTNIFSKVSNGEVYQNKQLNMVVSRPTRVWLIPYLHPTSNGTTGFAPQMSPLSMAPFFTSRLNLLNLQLHVSQASFFPQPINNKYILYDLYNKLNARGYGANAFMSTVKTGQWTFEQFCASPIYCFDLGSRYLDPITWGDNKTVGFSFQADFGANINGSFVVVIEQVQSFEFNRVTSLIGK